MQNTQTSNMKKLFLCCIFFVFLLTLFAPVQKCFVFAQNITPTNYVVYDQDGQFLLERIDVDIGDIYIDKKFNKYQIYLVDQTKQIARARFVETLQRPNVTKTRLEKIDQTQERKIALYLTHNDESYLIGDGTDSVYGKGGIHDVAKRMQDEFTRLGITVFLDESLHIPHDAYAYSRSRTTAKKLLQNKPNAIFDIHRDGASRTTYAKKYNGVEHSTVRIVVGQANPNYNQNLQLALYLLSVSESICPWLFLDVYYAKGHYNQDLFEKALLFEMGTYTIEKHLVMQTVEPLVAVINTTLFGTTVDTETGDLTIGGTNATQPTVDQVLSNNKSPMAFRLFSSAVAFLGLIGGAAFFVIKYSNKKCKNNQFLNLKINNK